MAEMEECSCVSRIRINNKANIKPLKRRESNQNLKKACVSLRVVVGHLPLPPHIPPFPPSKQSPCRGRGSFIPVHFHFLWGGGDLP